MRLSVGHTGDLAAALRSDCDRIRAGATRAMRKAAARLKANLRADTVAAGLGQRTANAWREETYPLKRESARPAGLVFTKAPNIIRAFDEGAYITGKNGQWLAIPLPAAGRAPKGKRMTPEMFERLRGLKLRFVYAQGKAKGKKAWLVVDGARLTGLRSDATGFTAGRAWEAKRKPRAPVTIPVFLLLRSTRLPKKLDLEARADEAQSFLANGLALEIALQFASGGRFE